MFIEHDESKRGHETFWLFVSIIAFLCALHLLLSTHTTTWQIWANFLKTFQSPESMKENLDTVLVTGLSTIGCLILLTAIAILLRQLKTNAAQLKFARMEISKLARFHHQQAFETAFSALSEKLKRQYNEQHVKASLTNYLELYTSTEHPTEFFRTIKLSGEIKFHYKIFYEILLLIFMRLPRRAALRMHEIETVEQLKVVADSEPLLSREYDYVILVKSFLGQSSLQLLFLYAAMADDDDFKKFRILLNRYGIFHDVVPLDGHQWPIELQMQYINEAPSVYSNAFKTPNIPGHLARVSGHHVNKQFPAGI
jgi:hypothetical protein